MRNGVALARWFACEARRVYAMLAQSEEEQEQDRIVRVIRRNDGRITPRELVQKVYSIKSVADAESCLDGLRESGFGAWCYPKPGPKGGQPTKLFVLQGGTGAYATPRGARPNGGSVDVDALGDSEAPEAGTDDGGRTE